MQVPLACTLMRVKTYTSAQRHLIQQYPEDSQYQMVLFVSRRFLPRTMQDEAGTVPKEKKKEEDPKRPGIQKVQYNTNPTHRGLHTNLLHCSLCWPDYGPMRRKSRQRSTATPEN